MLDYLEGEMRNRLAELRTVRGWTQQHLADLVGASRQTVISLERGRYNPSIILAFRLARTFEVDIEKLFLYEEDDDDER
jgi:putative transcriptional regulator